MFAEFFLWTTCRTKAFAWFGLVLFVGHQVFRAWLKYCINEWYGAFYNLLQKQVVEKEVDPELDEEWITGSGDVSSGDASLLTFASARQQVMDQLLLFALIVSPALIVNPIAGLIRNWWILRWRQALMETYLRKWNITNDPIEGASQRIHEDTERFASGIQSCVAVVLDSLFTLVIFCPLLYNIDPPLVAIAVGAAVGGVGVSALVGQRLVGLEVNNQRVEAALRKRLVVLEVDPTTIVAESQFGDGTSESTSTRTSTEHSEATIQDVVATVDGPLPAFYETIGQLIQNYRRLYLNFAALAAWLTLLDQALVILPYVLVAPRLFASEASDRMTLGELTQTANAFSKVFESLNVLSDNFLQFNAWRSVVRRLREFERELYNIGPPSVRLVAAGTELSDAPSHKPQPLQSAHMSNMSSTASEESSRV
jgi:peptide/bleomycin uptake transporter